MMQHIQVLVGIPAAGKSTYSRDAASITPGFIVINNDAIVTALHGGCYNLYNKTLKPLYKIVENSILTTSLARGKSVVIDRGNCSRYSRLKWLGIAKSFEVPIVAVTFPFESVAVHAARRTASESRGYSYEKWYEVSKRHLAEYEEPTLEEGFDKIYKIESWRDIETKKTLLQILEDFIPTGAA